ncbi:hypothetical protein [Flavobacterium silvaticum]|uniref:Uncharacterized protein n=1 Tax=Flavobacterium silvaticum TaxID=1852020 RepID=A0A972FLX6_9FLAO|nr:hypothetical protein [Flavobacterium silvaticum]NMH28067.1 hypothetical protein [Flavobacterium silvaticum]
MNNDFFEWNKKIQLSIPNLDSINALSRAMDIALPKINVPSFPYINLMSLENYNNVQTTIDAIQRVTKLLIIPNTNPIFTSISTDEWWRERLGQDNKWEPFLKYSELFGKVSLTGLDDSIFEDVEEAYGDSAIANLVADTNSVLESIATTDLPNAKIILINFLKKIFSGEVGKGVATNLLSSFIWLLITMVFFPAPSTSVNVTNNVTTNNIVVEKDYDEYLNDVDCTVYSRATLKAKKIDVLPLGCTIAILKDGRIWAKIFYTKPTGEEGFGWIKKESLSKI